MEISTALPCRILVYEDGSGLLALYGTPEPTGVAEDIGATLTSIMAEAAR